MGRRASLRFLIPDIPRIPPPPPPGFPQNVNELNQWLSALRKASAPNPDKLASCHPGAFRSSRWTCCLQAERSGEGQGGLGFGPPYLSISGCPTSSGRCATWGKLLNLVMPQSPEAWNGVDDSPCLLGL